ncbi:MAG: hypothetical protein SV765_02245 [Pseudomonadota bacterium]|nr:hypothetical protein [Pseudomonadales bacterium]MDY6919014.1 hypothetical protein [Pseudomonadota bacterium]
MALRGFWAGTLALTLLGCGDNATAPLQAQISRLEQQQQAQAQRLQALERVPQLAFRLTENQLTVEERMLRPVLTSRARLQAEGRQLPHTFYVDMLLQVEVPGEQFIATSRQIFPVFEGQSAIEMMQPLPVHGLTPDQIKVVMQPMNWYGSHRITEDQVSYQP